MAKRRRLTPNAAVLTLVAVLTIVVAFGEAAAWLLFGPPTPGGLHVPLLITLTVLFALVERFTVTFPVRRGAHAMTLSEIPLVLGLFLVPPVLLIPIRLVGALAGLILLRGHRGGKLAFNTALYLTQATVAGVVFHLIRAGTAPYGPVAWGAAFAAAFAADVVSIVLVTAVIAVHDDSQEWRRLLTADVKQVFQMPLVAVTTTLALVTVLLVREQVLAVLLLGVLAFAAQRVFHRYAQQSRTHQQVEDLYRFAQSLDGLTGADEVARAVLGQVRDLVRAEEAVLIVPGPQSEVWTSMRLYGRDRYRVEATPADAWWLPARSGTPVVRDTAIAVPLRLDESTGVLLVTGHMSEIPAFTADHVLLLQAMSSHAGAALSAVRLLDRLTHLASHDALTDLPNRQRFQADLQAATEAAGATGGTVGVLLMDLDRFKDVNDALGHDIGDDLLRRIGRRLRDSFAGLGVVSRFGGDEFALLVRDAGSEAELVALAEEVRRTVEKPAAVGDLILAAQVSIGVCLAPEHGRDAARLLRRADLAMYAAKAAQAGVRVYRPDDDRDTARRLTLMAGLRTAVDNHELSVVYQPKVDPRTGRVLGAEALTRWQHDGRPVPPDEFIPLAERCGLIGPLTRHVLETALTECATWRAAGHDLSVAVNLAPGLLSVPDLTDRVDQALRRHGLPPSALTLEITENGIMSEPEHARRALDALDRLGVKLSIDDFGTGHSSLGRLAHLPIHEVKIDKSFIRHIDTDRNRRAVTDAALQLARALDLQVVAEGVEVEAELDYLRRNGCDAIQGYLISKPISAPAFLDWLTVTVPTSLAV
ncbi:signal transduction protein containing a membrane domain an EAL and a GGDEF domain [Actinoplanes sp. SE50]|uniref:putative bifunctional diguanylate cyclase/phosphodiesterase n=1 Tax=unclassified Actinoplanes TaxID=2626549 RepID=UPI00023ED478|nr:MULTISPECIES: GGDEF domain-containing phosphodiesterase [unclassified Actinoplanes]AEV85616.1 signal transduction protein containing a membrane domain an EAL and a GGDEF domain [Actinoplanes sp. SE50/110]ATO84009.1 signal transduction protein containing a membrane domain an EAL and a GGDEF domain [Actinoplanes sp. SE50]SLM01419.1 signal transduction protein containing a membrane domain an EAL and a GGDEF domain [Actinoplanes sp. SE50/110]